MMLERSRDCLLDVSDTDENCGYSDPREDSYPLLWPQIHRVRSMFLTQSPPTENLGSSKRCAPRLESYVEDYPHFSYGEEDPFLPLIETPRLRRAKLMTPSIHALRPLNNLSQLELFWSADNDEINVVSFEDVMTILSNLPCLSTLRIALQFCLWEEDPTVPLDCPTVLFRYLKHLEFIKPCDVVGAGLFLEYAKFSMPLSIVVVANADSICHVHPQPQQLAVEGVRRILKRWPPPGANPGLHLRLIDRPRAGGMDNTTVDLSVPMIQSTKKPKNEDEKTEEESLLLLAFPWHRETGIYCLLPPLCPNLRLLTISSHLRTSRMQAFREMLGKLKAVEVITITHSRSMCTSCGQRGRRPDTHQLQFIDLGKVFTDRKSTR